MRRGLSSVPSVGPDTTVESGFVPWSYCTPQLNSLSLSAPLEKEVSFGKGWGFLTPPPTVPFCP